MAMIAAIRTRTPWEMFSIPGISTIPSTADMILMAGVITPSPKSSDTPRNERNPAKASRRPDFNSLIRISLRTISPPCPFFPRLMANQAYSPVTRMVMVQKTRERMPNTFSWVGLVRAKITVRV